MSSLKRIPSCPLCSKRFRLVMSRQVPRLMPPCGHTVCDSCVESIGYATSPPSCPCCQAGPLPADRSTLPINDIVAAYAERAIAAAADDGSARATCDGCKADGLDAALCTHKCETCDKHMCAEHSRIHERRGHKVKRDDAIPVTKSGSGECARHPGQPVFFYCFSCNVPACQSCTVLEHPPASHDIKDAKASADILAKRLDNGVRRCVKAISDIEATGGTVKEAMTSEARVKDASIDAINAATEAIISAVRGKMDALKAIVTSRWENNTRLMQAQMDGMKLKYNQLQLMCEVGLQVAAAKDPVDISRTMEIMAIVANMIQPYPGLPFDASQSVITAFDLGSVLSAVEGLPNADGAPLVTSLSPQPHAPPLSQSHSPVTADAVPPPPPPPLPSQSQPASAAHTPTHPPKPSPVAVEPERRPRIASTSGGSVPTTSAASATISAMQSQLAAKFASGGPAPFGAVPVMMRPGSAPSPAATPQPHVASVRSPAADVEGERKSDTPTPASAPAPTPPVPTRLPIAIAAPIEQPNGLSIVHTAQLKSLFKLAGDGQSWDSKATGIVGAVVIGARK